MTPQQGTASRTPLDIEWMLVDGTEEAASAAGRWCSGMRHITHRSIDGDMWGVDVPTPTGLVTARTHGGDNTPAYVIGYPDGTWGVLQEPAFTAEFTVTSTHETERAPS